MGGGFLNIYALRGVEFTRVADALREIDVKLPTKFRTKLRKAAQPLVQEVKDNVRALPVYGDKHTGLRRRVARGVRVQAAVGDEFRFRIVTSMEDPREAAIPRGLDRERGWRHPVFGTNQWVDQHGSSWFIDTLQNGRVPLEKALQQELEDARDMVARAGSV